MKAKSLLLATVAVLMGAATATAAEYWVSPSGKDSNPGTEAAPFGSPEMAFMSLKPNDPSTVHIANGTYMVGSLRIEDNVNVTVAGEGNAILKGAEKSGRDGGEASRILRIGKNTNVTISGMTFLNGRQVGYYPGGAIFFLGTDLTVDNCAFIDNQGSNAGGAIGSRGKNVTVKNSYFKGNRTEGGGANGAAISVTGDMASGEGSLIVENCCFEGNGLEENGGGTGICISLYEPADNSGGAGYSLVTKFSCTNCTFFNNKSIQGYVGDIDISSNPDAEVTIVNNTFISTEAALTMGFREGETYLFNNFIYAAKQGIGSTTSIAESDRTAITAANNYIYGGEAAINDNIDDGMFNANGNVLGKTADNSLASFAMDNALTFNGNIGYLAFGATSKLIGKGMADSSALSDGTNLIPALDCRGAAIYDGGKDVGAYEYNPEFDGIATVTISNDAPAIYYNLQGVRVANPAGGIFIERRGNTTRKVIL